MAGFCPHVDAVFRGTCKVLWQFPLINSDLSSYFQVFAVF
jgi:hypothetical protein